MDLDHRDRIDLAMRVMAEHRSKINAGQNGLPIDIVHGAHAVLRDALNVPESKPADGE